MNLKAYLAQIDMSLKDFADSILYTNCYLSRVMNGHLKPSKKLIKLVDKFTDGKVCLSPEKTEAMQKVECGSC